MPKNDMDLGLMNEDISVNRGRPTSTPIFQTATFFYDSFDEVEAAMRPDSGRYVYSKTGNPTVDELESQLAELEGGEAAKIFSSGTAAVSTACMAYLHAGAHVVCVSDAYSWTKRFFEDYVTRFGVGVTFISGEDPAEWECAVRPNTTLFFLESPTTFSMKLQDLTAVAKIALNAGVTTIVDNTWASPLFQRPLDLGIDLVIHSCSKYLGGHSDVISGAVIGSKKEIERIFNSSYLHVGALTNPIESWLVLRGLKTLRIRMETHYSSTLVVLRELTKARNVEVLYPLLDSHPQHYLANHQLSGGGGLFTLVLENASLTEVKTFVNTLRMFKKTVSWGGHDSLVLPLAACYPCPESEVGIIRMFIGLDDPNLLVNDINVALEKIGRL